MKRIFFHALYLISPVIPSALFFASSGGGLNGYSASVILGVYAFVLLCNQLILATRPKIAVTAMGIKGLLALHGTAPIFILGMAIVHRILKEASGFDMGSAQAIIGMAVLAVFFIASMAAFLLLANVKPPLGTKLRTLRIWVEKTFKLGYKASRALHAITVLALAALAVHVSLASSASLAANPFGAVWLGAWFTFSLGMYIRYRVRGRPNPKIEIRAPKQTEQ
jgi:predicted ferric reductase